MAALLTLLVRWGVVGWGRGRGPGRGGARGAHVGLTTVVAVLALLTQPAPVASIGPDCQNRPPVRVTTERVAGQQLRVTVTVQDSPSVPQNELAALRFKGGTNALVDVGNQTGRIGAFDIPLPPGTRQVTFTVRQQSPGQPVLVPFVAVDTCGDWQTFVGGGVESFAPANSLPVLGISGPTIPESNAGVTPATFTVSMSVPSNVQVSGAFSTVDGTATATDNDYLTVNGAFTIPPGEIQTSITVPVVGDTKDENDETFGVQISNANNATVGPQSRANATIKSDDPPVLSLQADGTGTFVEGVLGGFTVRLSRPTDKPVTFTALTAGGTASDGEDFVSFSSTFTIPPGQQDFGFGFRSIDDTKTELTETVLVQVLNVQNATLTPESIITLFIEDNDPPPTIQVASASIAEGDAGTKTLFLKVTLSRATDFSVSANFQTRNGSATAGSDYVATGGTISIFRGQSEDFIRIPILGDTDVEPDETIVVDLSNPVNASISPQPPVIGVIVNDDGPKLKLKIFGTVASAPEGNTGQQTRSFFVLLKNDEDVPTASTQPVTFTVSTEDFSATAADNDYLTVNGAFTIPPGEVQTEITVPVVGDTKVEPNEAFVVNLSNPVNAELGSPSSAVSTIANDD